MRERLSVVQEGSEYERASQRNRREITRMQASQAKEWRKHWAGRRVGSGWAKGENGRKKGERGGRIWKAWEGA